MKDLPRLLTVTRPKEIALGRAGTVVKNDHAGRSLPKGSEVPNTSGRNLKDGYFPLDGKIPRRAGYPVEKRTPDIRRGLSVQTVEQHGNFNPVAALKSNLLA